MNGYPFNNPDLKSFYGGGRMSRPFANRGLSDLPRSSPSYHRPAFLHGLGSTDATSEDPTDVTAPYVDSNTGNTYNNQTSTPVPLIDTSGAGGPNMTTAAQDVSSLVNSIRSGAQGILQFEAAQNAINAQRNLTTALTPGMITLLLGGLVFWLVTKK